MIAATVELYGGLDILHSNAGATQFVRHNDHNLLDTDVEVWDRVLRTELRSHMIVARYAIPHMLARGGGSIINTASDAGRSGDIGHTAYGVAKAGLIMLTMYTATQYGKQGIRCNALAPGLIVTGAPDAAFRGDALEMMLSHHLTPRLGRPEDVAHAVLYLASDDSAFVTGQVISVDGGLLSHAPQAADIRKAMAASGS
jgi:NAD(P)-dependent dehydrogenase (short-subunit alcohol dehydrogenase family)